MKRLQAAIGDGIDQLGTKENEDEKNRHHAAARERQEDAERNEPGEVLRAEYLSEEHEHREGRDDARHRRERLFARVRFAFEAKPDGAVDERQSENRQDG